MNARNTALDATINQFKLQYFLSKIAVNFSTVLYLMAGLGMLVISFWLEAEVFSTLLGDSPFISYATAACLEGAKLGTIIVYDFIDRKKQIQSVADTGWQQIKANIQLLFKRFFQLSLFLMSMLCVATIISTRFDNPHQEETRQHDLTTLQTNYERSRKELIDLQANEQQQQTAQNDKAIAAVISRYQPRINQLLEALEIERHNVGRNGVVEGDKYDSYQGELDTQNTNLQNAVSTQNNLTTQQISQIDQRYAAQLATLNTQFKENQTQLEHKNYDGDLRVEHKNIRAIVKTMNAVLHFVGYEQQLQPIIFVAIFSIMLSAIIECGIFLSLSSFVEVFFPHEFNVIELEQAEAQKKTSRYGLNQETT